MKDELHHIPLDKLRPPKISLRSVRKNSVEFQELIESIRVDGVLQSLLVRPVPGTDEFEVVEGEHRRVASTIAGRDDVPCIVREMTDDEAVLVQLKANAVRPLETQVYEYARRLRKFLDDGVTLAALSNKIDKSNDWIRRMLRLNNLRAEAIEPVNRGDIPLKSAIALATLPQELQEQFIEDAKVMKTREFVNRARAALADYEAFLQNQTQEEQAKGIEPRLRSLHDIRKELDGWGMARRVLDVTRAKTPEDGYKAALAWMLKIDPISIHHRLNKISEGRRERLNAHDKRKLRRKIVDTLVIDSLKPGDQTHGE